MTILDYIKIIWWSIGEMPYYIKLAWYIYKRDVDKCLNILWEIKKYDEKHFGAWTLEDHINIMDTVREYGQITNNEFEAGLICQVFDLDVAKEIEKEFGL